MKEGRVRKEGMGNSDGGIEPLLLGGQTPVAVFGDLYTCFSLTDELIECDGKSSPHSLTAFRPSVYVPLLQIIVCDYFSIKGMFR